MDLTKLHARDVRQRSEIGSRRRSENRKAALIAQLYVVAREAVEHAGVADEPEIVRLFAEVRAELEDHEAKRAS